MRRGEYDAFNDGDLLREFQKCAPPRTARLPGMRRWVAVLSVRAHGGRYGTVTRAEMTLDKDTGWSKGFGFVSFAAPEEADAALAAVHGAWMDGREMKVEKTKEDH